MDSILYKPFTYPQTPEKVRAYFYQHGITICGWARAMNLPEQSVKDVIYKRSPGRSGKAHKAAVALGLKLDPEHSKKV